jgi:hypothetical protein
LLNYILASNGLSGLHIEWSKSGARAARWSEDTTLLVEEMRRVLWYFRWRRQWWHQQANLRHNARADIREGLVAYSSKQAAVLDHLAVRFADEWYSFLTTHGFDTEWPEEYLEGRSHSAGKKIVQDRVGDDSDEYDGDDDIDDLDDEDGFD